MNTGKRITRGLGLLICLTTVAIPALAQDYDLVINVTESAEKIGLIRIGQFVFSF